MKEHIKKTLEFYAHDYRDIALKEDDLKDMLEGFFESMNCDHECTSNCRREGCKCNCGNFHFN
jgi:hypothetical protein